MTATIVSSPTREVVIGHDRPFTIIGERISPTGGATWIRADRDPAAAAGRRGGRRGGRRRRG